MSTSTLSAEAQPSAPPATQRLAVAWQHPTSRRIDAVGLLTCGEDGFTFSYLRAASQVEGFQPFLSLPDTGRTYVSANLFPLFAQRVMRSTRPDFERYLNVLSLPEGTNDWSILGRSQGQREGDGVRLFAEPEVDENSATSATFFASGLRHRLVHDSDVAPALAALNVGDTLTLRAQPDNPSDDLALLVAERTGVALAWVPSVLLPYVRAARSTAEPALSVAATKGPDVPPGYRLLVTLRGRVPAGYQPFSGAGWEL